MGAAASVPSPTYDAEEDRMWNLGWRSSEDAVSTRQITERELKLDYFGHVFADYSRLSRTTRDELLQDLPENLKALLTTVAKEGKIPDQQQDAIEWSQIATVEDKILARQDDIVLRRRAWELRSRYGRLVGPERYQQYLTSRPPDETDTTVSIEALRADLREVLGLTHFSYSLAVVRENLRRRTLMGVLWLATLGCGTALIAAIIADYYRLDPDGNFIDRRFSVALVVIVVVMFGCLGAFLSTQRRLQQPSEGGDPLIAILGLYEFNNVKRFPLIAGGLFAIVLYFVIVAGFLKGDLFPNLVAGVPLDSVAWAKLSIWALLSGFAERLVPDTLDRLVNQVQPRVPVSPPSGSGTTAGTQVTAEPKRNGERRPLAPVVPPVRPDPQLEQADVAAPPPEAAPPGAPPLEVPPPPEEQPPAVPAIAPGENPGPAAEENHAPAAGDRQEPPAGA
jgi:hypothetical protein